MTSTENLILDDKQIDQRILRIAYQIYENNVNEKKVILAGVSDNGIVFANLIKDELEEISPLECIAVRVDINKKAPFKDDIFVDIDDKEMSRTAVILIDDVLNSGKTAAFALKAFLNTNIKKIELAVMVNRSHKQFPISPKYAGYEMATTITEHVEVVLQGKNKGVYLS